MKIGIPAERRAGETRVAATPETVKKLVAAKQIVLVESGAGVSAGIADADFVAAGATIVGGCCGIGPDHISALSADLSDG